MAVIDTVAKLSRRYTKLRRKYFLEPGHSDYPVFVPPPARLITFGWLPENSPSIGETNFDEDKQAFEVFIDPNVGRIPRVAEWILIHELTHMRLGPEVGCHPGSKRWKEEIMRLAALGADIL